MARICPLTGRRPVKGNHIWRSGKAKKKGGIGTHVTAITKRKFYPNLQYKRFWLEEEKRWVELRVTPKGMKTINKLGLMAAMKQAKELGYIA